MNMAHPESPQPTISLLRVLDCKDITIHKVTDERSGQDLKFCLGTAVDPFGSKLEITLPPVTGKSVSVKIEYETSPQCSALQWLTPEQTAGKRQPYLFSQCQAIHARSLVPCQDTPAVKSPYTAEIIAPKDIVILMSAIRQGCEDIPGDCTKKVHKFEQKVPIPTYLIAIVGGDLEYRDIGPRSKVWSEKEMVDKAAYEFAETENMLKTAESLMGPYVWGQYDLLVLPPSFPFGGMENPCLTFVTPTLLAGDRSLADVVAHEITHSWTGNLVTNNSPDHFWLNEGHTTFLERKVTARLHSGEKFRQFMALDGWKDLKDAVETIGPKHDHTKLVLDLRGVDPDDAFSTVPYEKGFALLFYLETLLGGPDVFEKFLRAYIENFKLQSIDSNQWKDFLFSYFKDKISILETVDWNTWFYGVGMPPVKPQYDTSLADICHQLGDRWSAASDGDLSAFSPTDLSNLSSVQVRQFLNHLLQQPPLSVAKLEKMEELYQLMKVQNSEVHFRWLRLCIRGEWSQAIAPALKFVSDQGRMKFVRPLYREMYQWEVARPAAVENFKKQRPTMHNTTASLVAKDLHLK
ncbi:leukotriene A-4 hydrolase-like isoform X1 [Liolophura sinensis]|uniref:leukotriene A-4 hydrolase-like isoform X1 n=1 Tax=Liolophura sinensis TaxID=3198878 RepID=UPI003158FA6C